MDGQWSKKEGVFRKGPTPNNVHGVQISRSGKEIRPSEPSEGNRYPRPATTPSAHVGLPKLLFVVTCHGSPGLCEHWFRKNGEEVKHWFRKNGEEVTEGDQSTSDLHTHAHICTHACAHTVRESTCSPMRNHFST